MIDDKTARIRTNIAACQDATKLRQYMKNAKGRGRQDIYDAAFDQLVSVLPSARRGTVEYDVWVTIHTFEEILTEERRRTTRLMRTRQSIDRKGEVRTVGDLMLKSSPSDGFSMLKERGRLDLSFELLVLKHADAFSSLEVKAARSRLADAHWTGEV